MANEITATVALALTNGSLKMPQKLYSKAITQTTAKRVSNTQTIGFAAHEALAMGDVAAAGVCQMTNLDDTNFVQIGVDSTGTFVAFVKLLPGESWQGRLATNAPYAQADTGAVELDYDILSD